MLHFHRLCILLGLSSLGFVSGCGGGAMATPTTFRTWNAKDGTFVLQYPSEWKAEGGGKHGVQWAEFQQGSAHISIKVSLVSSLIGDIAQAGANAAGLNDPFNEIDPERKEKLAPVTRAHEVGADMFTKEFSRYKEEPPVAFDSGFGDSRKSEFTARSGLSGRLRGYRATMLGSDRGVHVCCWCKESDWKNLKPVFDGILAGMRQGTPE